MHVRRATAWISTALVAIAVAIAVPVSQLHTVSIVKWCCCPDPSNCHCPDETGRGSDPSTPPSVRACHNTEHAMIAPQLPAFSAPAFAVAAAPAVVVAVLAPEPAAPHPAPPPQRPDAPS